LPKDSIVMIYNGGLEPGTYVDILIQAVRILKVKHPSRVFQLVVVGGGTWEKGLQQMSRDLGCEDRVTFLGMVPFKDVVRYLSAADLGMAPYTDTPYTASKSPLKIVEYLSAGLPIIGNRVGDVEELTGDAGCILDRLDPVSTAETIERLASDADTRQRYSERARQRAESIYDYRKTSKALIAQLEREVR
jgi:glycosyltransferase involved in cell wall biosynthesis